jgi:uncharacterized protein (TIGR03435 family)
MTLSLSRTLLPLLLAPAIIHCQPPAPELRFEVASVKRNTTLHNGIGNKFGPASVRWTNVPLKVLLGQIFRLKDYQILGGPAWIDSEPWDIDAKAAAPATSEQKDQMMTALLADRFQLRFHRESRQMPIYRLVLAKGGSKLTPAHEQDATHRWGTTPGPSSLEMKGASMQEFAWWLSAQLQQPIVESTGLTGRYDLKLQWAQDDNPAPSGDAAPDAVRLPVFAAIELQLGLKLEPGRGPVDVLIVDHVERPTGN